MPETINLLVFVWYLQIHSCSYTTKFHYVIIRTTRLHPAVTSGNWPGCLSRFSWSISRKITSTSESWSRVSLLSTMNKYFNHIECSYILFKPWNWKRFIKHQISSMSAETRKNPEVLQSCHLWKATTSFKSSDADFRQLNPDRWAVTCISYLVCSVFPL